MLFAVSFTKIAEELSLALIFPLSPYAKKKEESFSEVHTEVTITNFVKHPLTCKLGKKQDSMSAGFKWPKRGATSRVIRK